MYRSNVPSEGPTSPLASTAPASPGEPAFMTETTAGALLPGAIIESPPASVLVRDLKDASMSMSQSFATPRKAARARLLSKTKGGSDSDITDDDEALLPETTRAAVRFGGGAKPPSAPAAPASPAAAPARRNGRPDKVSLLGLVYPGVDASGTVLLTDDVPLDHRAIQSIVESVTRSDPSLAFDGNVARFVRTSNFSRMSTASFWIWALKCKANLLESGLQERMLRGEPSAALQAELDSATTAVALSESDGFKCAAMAYGTAFGRMLARQGHAVSSAVAIRDSLHQRLPILLAKTTYYLLTLVFSSTKDTKMFNPAVREGILVMISKWVAGVEPQNAYMQAHAHWPAYTRRREAKQQTTFDADALTKQLDERSREEFEHARSMRLHDFFGGSGLRRGGDLGERVLTRGSSMSLRRGKGPGSLAGLRSSQTSGPDGMSSRGSFVSGAPRGGGAPSERSSAKDGGSTTAVASPRTVKIQSVAPTLHDANRWYEEGGIRGCLAVERVTETKSPRQAWSFSANSPLMLYYFEQSGILAADPGQSGKSMVWTSLSALDRQGVCFKFSVHSKPIAVKAIAYGREDRRVRDTIIDKNRRDVIASQRNARFNAGKAKLAALHINALYSMEHPKTKALYQTLRAKLLSSIAKSRRRGDAHITEVIALADGVLKEAADYVCDLPYHARLEVQRLSLACYRGVQRLSRFHKVVTEGAAAKEHLTYHSLSAEGSRALARVCDLAVKGQAPNDEELSRLLNDAAATAAREHRLMMGLEPDGSDSGAEEDNDSLHGAGDEDQNDRDNEAAPHSTSDNDVFVTDRRATAAVIPSGGDWAAVTEGQADFVDSVESSPLPASIDASHYGGVIPSGTRPPTTVLPSGASYSQRRNEALQLMQDLNNRSAHPPLGPGSRPPRPPPATARPAQRPQAYSPDDSSRDVASSELPSPSHTFRVSAAASSLGIDDPSFLQSIENAWALVRQPLPTRVKPPSMHTLQAAESDLKEVQMPSTTYHTARTSRASPRAGGVEPTTATLAEAVDADSLHMSPSRVRQPVLPIARFTSQRHSVRHPMDMSDVTADAVSPPRVSPRIVPPKEAKSTVEWWQTKDEAPAVIVASPNDVRRPDTTPHFQRATESNAIKRSGVSTVSMSVERQVAMATAAAAASSSIGASLPSLNASMVLRATVSAARSPVSSRPSTQPRTVSPKAPKPPVGHSPRGAQGKKAM
jgi:hypothetical protein